MPLTLLENEICKAPPVCVADESGNRTIRKVMIPYDYATLPDLLRIFRGYTTVNEGTGELTRVLPYTDPDDREQVVQRCEHTGWVYRGRFVAFDDGLPFFTGYKPEKWVVTLSFMTVQHDLGEGEYQPSGLVLGETPEDETTRYAWKDSRPDREYLNPPRGWAYLNGKQVSIPIPTVVPFDNLECTWFQVPLLLGYPNSAIEDCLGKINNAPLTLPAGINGKVTYDAGTIHLLGVRPKLIYQVDSSKAADVVYMLRHRQLGWNNFPDSNDTWYPLTRGAGGGTSLFKTADFSYLWKSERKWELDS